MPGTQITKSLPSSNGPDRDAAIIAAVRAGNYVPIVWREVMLRHGTMRAIVRVSSDVLRLGSETDSIRINASATLQQLIADALGCVLPTSKISDAIFEQAAVIVAPQTQYPCTSSTAAMARHDAAIEVKRAGREGLIASVGKDWVLSNRLRNRPNKGANYGWHRGDGRLWQGPKGYPGTAHNRHHVDYSQTVRLVRRLVWFSVNGEPFTKVAFEDIATDPTMAPVVYDETPFAPLEPLHVLRIETEEPKPSDPKKAVPAATVAPGTTDFFELGSRTIKRGSSGDDVAAWQVIIGAVSDGDFGPNTERMTRAWQRTQGLRGDGIVGPKTIAAIGAKPKDIPPIEPSIKFVQARNFTWANRASVDVIVIHTMEAAETLITAENVANWFASEAAPRASAHYNVDGDSIVQSVKEEHVAWHAPGANRNGIGIEHAGYARQSDGEWADPYSRSMLELSAWLVASICKRWGIPVVRLSSEDLIRGKRGLCGHREVTRAFKKSTHTDPGEHFPWTAYLEAINRLL